MKVSDLVKATREGQPLIINDREISVPQKTPKDWGWVVFNGVLITVLLGILVVGIIIITKLPTAKEAYQSKENKKSILKFTRIMTCNDRILMIELPNVKLPYQYRIKFLDITTRTDESKIKSLMAEDLLILKFDKIESEEKQFVVEIYIEESDVRANLQ